MDPECTDDTPDGKATTKLTKNAWDAYLATMQQMVRDVHGRMVYKSPDDIYVLRRLRGSARDGVSCVDLLENTRGVGAGFH